MDNISSIFNKIINTIKKYFEASIKFIKRLWVLAWMPFHKVPAEERWPKVLATFIQIAVALLLLYIAVMIILLVFVLYMVFAVLTSPSDSSKEKPTNNNNKYNERQYRNQRDYEIFLLEEEDRKKKQWNEEQRIRAQMRARR